MRTSNDARRDSRVATPRAASDKLNSRCFDCFRRSQVPKVSLWRGNWPASGAPDSATAQRVFTALSTGGARAAADDLLREAQYGALHQDVGEILVGADFDENPGLTTLFFDVDRSFCVWFDPGVTPPAYSDPAQMADVLRGFERAFFPSSELAKVHAQLVAMCTQRHVVAFVDAALREQAVTAAAVTGTGGRKRAREEPE